MSLQTAVLKRKLVQKECSYHCLVGRLTLEHAFDQGGCRELDLIRLGPHEHFGQELATCVQIRICKSIIWVVQKKEFTDNGFCSPINKIHTTALKDKKGKGGTQLTTKVHLF